MDRTLSEKIMIKEFIMLTFGSLFAGIGGFDLAFERVGMHCLWQVEIDEKCQGVLANHWPSVRRYGDVKECGKHNLAAVDVICGGFPCQDVSVAGKRKGLVGERSGLWFEFHRILEELRPRWAVVENVPGLLSSNGGRDFAVLLQGLAQLGYGVSWRICNAEYFGVPQRRRRVFIVGSLGDGCSAEILFEREGGCWDPAPSREAGKKAARDVGACLKGDSRERGRPSETLVAEAIDVRNLRKQPDGISGTLQHKKSGGYSLNYQNPVMVAGASETLVPYTVHGEHSTAMTGKGKAAVAFESKVARSLDQCGGYATNQGGNVVVAVSENQRAEVRLTPYSRQLTTGGGKPGQGYPCVLAFQSKASANQSMNPSEIMPTLDVGKADGNAVIAFGGDRDGQDAGPIAPPLRHCGDEPQHHNAYDKPSIASAFGVRRLTPVECERLQSFPDYWTAWAVAKDGKHKLSVQLPDGTFIQPQADSNRYRQLGNAICVNVAEWIGDRITRTVLSKRKLDQRERRPDHSGLGL